MTKTVVCRLEHPSFHTLGEPMFCLSAEQKAPVMVVQIDHHEAVLSLRSLRREFKIDPDGADGQMLTLIEQALDFVVALRLGDTFPAELFGGEVNWKPTLQDRKLAASRVRHDLVQAMGTRTGQPVPADGAIVAGWENDPVNRELLCQAIDGVATLLGGIDAGEVALRIDLISEEFGYIENMRCTLARGMAGINKLLSIRADGVSLGRRSVLVQVQTLTRRGLKVICAQVADIDAGLHNVPAMLADMTAGMEKLRHQRDCLFRVNHGWEPIFTDWAGEAGQVDDALWKVVDKTYQFLAPRFMSMNEWAVAQAKPKPQGRPPMIW